MKVLNILNIKILLILFLSFFFFNCNQNKVDEEDVKAIIKIMDRYTHSNSGYVIADKLGVLRLEQHMRESLEMATKEGLEPNLIVEDLDYFDKQLKTADERIRYWSERNIPIEGKLIDVFEISKDNQVYSREWWTDFKDEYNINNVKMYSYPVFNLKHDIALITYREFTYEIEMNSGYITCTFFKDVNEGWKRVSCKPIN